MFGFLGLRLAIGYLEGQIVSGIHTNNKKEKNKQIFERIKRW